MLAYKYQQLGNEEKDLLSCISLFDNQQIDIRDIFTFFKDEEEDDVCFFDMLHDLSLCGWLQYEKEKYIITPETQAIVQKENPPSTDKCFKVLKYLSDYLFDNKDDMKKMKPYIPFIEKIFKNIEGESDSLALLANDYSYYLKEIDKKEASKEFALKAVDIQKGTNDKHPQLGFYYNRLASVCMEEGELNKTLTYGFKSIKLSKEIPYRNNFDIVSSYNIISTAFDKLKKHDKSITYGLKAIQIVEDNYNSEKIILSNLYHDISISYFKARDYNNASRFINLAIKNYQFKRKNVDEHIKEMELFQKGISAVGKFKQIKKKYLKYILIGLGIITTTSAYFIFF